MIQISDPKAMLDWSREQRGSGCTIGLVPTMGFLHEGHLKLIDRARSETDRVVVSLFVNPMQFGPKEDFSTYPRDLESDFLRSESRGTDCLFTPETPAMYPSEPIVRVSPGRLADRLCGVTRPGHFEGVLTVVAKLFNLVEPDAAVFGRKDFQQARLIEKMVEDLSMPVRVIVASTVREPDGLAMSSRNTYLSSKEREAAAKLSQGLEAAHRAFVSGTTDAAALGLVIRDVTKIDPLIHLEYVEVVDALSLLPVASATERSVVALAAHVGPARLIDNIVLGRGVAGDDKVAG